VLETAARLVDYHVADHRWSLIFSQPQPAA
jgi:hypothetical protein